MRNGALHLCDPDGRELPWLRHDHDRGLRRNHLASLLPRSDASQRVLLLRIHHELRAISQTRGEGTNIETAPM